MNILLSNDDGIHSQGILLLADALKDLGHVTVVAPQRERSTTGHSLTLHKPLRCLEVKENHYAVSGSPADCVYLATRHLCKTKPDIIVSGVNRGANLGNDIYYSGTVAAAREGAYFGLKAIAISLCLNDNAGPLHWETANDFTKKFVPQVMSKNIPKHHVLNVNVPNLPQSEIRGVRMSTQGIRYYSDTILENSDPRGKPYYWIGGSYQGFEKMESSDCVHVDEGFISVTPLKTDCTDYNWKNDFSF
jgi:5'-nucleotidase